MAKYCCFFDPQKNYEEKELHDTCPVCGKKYDYPLMNAPKEIINGDKKYVIEKAIARGFYSATYKCSLTKTYGTQTRLIKIIPEQIYAYFGKDFNDECMAHARVAAGKEHIVAISDAFSADVQFGDNKLKCFIVEMDYIDGVSLDDYISNSNNVTPVNFAQIAIDLLRLWAELIAQPVYHNDLHAGNLIIENLRQGIQRSEALNDRIRLVAIDLNSASDDNLSDSSRRGDQAHISCHIHEMVEKLRSKCIDIDSEIDIEYRLMETLERIEHIIIPKEYAADLPTTDELIKTIKNEFDNGMSYSPWKKVLSLTRLNDGVNAQTIHSCYVPALLEDPNGEWLKEITIAEPQLITGMRGCGKTMFLNSIDFHARLHGEKHGESSSKRIARITKDTYVGLLASCRYIVNCDINDVPSFLIWLYATESVRLCRHLNDVDHFSVNKTYGKDIIDIINILFKSDIDFGTNPSLYSIEKHLVVNNNRFFDSGKKLHLSLPVNDAFELLAATIRKISPIFASKRIFFLLDDASTRYLAPDKISELFRRMLFMSTSCSFKITTELQSTIRFKSAGNYDWTCESRDYQIFDLGAKVFEETRKPSGKNFVANILDKRKRFCPSYPEYSSEEILGDCKLKQIAEKIVNSKEKSKERKSIYHGITALASLCVGDIGDVIFLYDSIVDVIKKNSKVQLPIAPEKQTECYQQLCSRRMYNLNKRNDELFRQYVECFADAAYTLLIESHVTMNKQNVKRDVLRQYNGLYVKITSGDEKKQLKKLRTLTRQTHEKFL